MFPRAFPPGCGVLSCRGKLGYMNRLPHSLVRLLKKKKMFMGKPD